LHDIGKIAIPDVVLLKPGRLTDAEFEIVKKHTIIGYQTLEEVFRLYPNELLDMAMTISRSHHEKWDGSGYPDGLTGDEIPLCARIMGIVDVYDAIRSKRCYKKAMSHAAACSIIVKDSGKNFDPQLVETFLILQDEFLKIYNDI
jgi:putative two-component system response regulator